MELRYNCKAHVTHTCTSRCSWGWKCQGGLRRARAGQGTPAVLGDCREHHMNMDVHFSLPLAGVVRRVYRGRVLGRARRRC